VRALLFPVGEAWYALPLTVVREVIPAPHVTRIPTAPAWIAGVVNLRGEVLPVLDTAARLGFEGQGNVSHVAIVDTDKGPAGLCIGGTPEPAELGDPSGAGEGTASIARYAVGDKVATLLDVGDLATGA
jgi:chemotaxis signal transduction protein